MPLYDNAESLIRRNLEEIAKGNKVQSVLIGTLSDKQLTEINEFRAQEDLPALSGEIFFIGRHVHRSRILQNGYTIEDVVDQIVSGMNSESAVLVSETRT